MASDLFKVMAGVVVGDVGDDAWCRRLLAPVCSKPAADSGAGAAFRASVFLSSESCTAVSGAEDRGLLGVVGVAGTANVAAGVLVGDKGAGLLAEGVEAADD